MMRRVWPLILVAGLLAWPGASWGQRQRPAPPPPASSRAWEATPALAPATLAAEAAGPRELVGIPEYRLQEAGSERSLLWDGARMALSLAAVLLILGVGVKLLRRWPGLMRGEAAAGSLELLGRLPLSAKEAVCLVRAGGELLVVGVSPSGVSLLHRLEGGAAELGRVTASGSAARGAGHAPPAGFRLRELAARVREVQSNWRIGPEGRGDAR